MRACVWGRSLTIATLLVALRRYVLYLATRDQYYLFARFGGFQGVTAGLLVALRQTSADEPFAPDLLPPLAALGLRHRHLSGAFVTATAVLTLFNGAMHHHIGLCSFVLFGSYYAWVYLRFFQPVAVACGARAAAGGDTSADGAATLRGDPREEFSFASLFPTPLQPAISRLAAPAYACCCAPTAKGGGAAHAPRRAAAAASSSAGSPPRQRSPPMARPEAAAAQQGTPGGDAARQRELAARGMRLLEARLSTAGGGPTPPRPARAAAADAAAAAAAAAPQPAAAQHADEAV